MKRGILAAAGANPVVEYTTWNPADKGSEILITGGNLVLGHTTGNAWQSVRAIKKFTGKQSFVCRVFVDVGQLNIIPGAMNLAAVVSSFCGADTNGIGYYCQDGASMTNSALTPMALAAANGDYVMFAVDEPARLMTVLVNGASAGTVSIPGTGDIYPTCSLYGDPVHVFTNFGQATFPFAPPAGFAAGVF